jgi:hypothetical protein
VSYQVHRRYGDVVVCDSCSRLGAIGDHDWHEMRQDSQGQAIHLCRACRRVSIWCEVHGQYHLPESLHRRPCAECGGLFTSQVTKRIEHCPQCRRLLPALPAAKPPVRAPARGGLFYLARWYAGARARRL